MMVTTGAVQERAGCDEAMCKDLGIPYANLKKLSTKRIQGDRWSAKVDAYAVDEAASQEKCAGFGLAAAVSVERNGRREDFVVMANDMSQLMRSAGHICACPGA